MNCVIHVYITTKKFIMTKEITFENMKEIFAENARNLDKTMKGIIFRSRFSNRHPSRKY